MIDYEVVPCQIVAAPPGWRAVLVWEQDDEVDFEEQEIALFALMEHRPARSDRALDTPEKRRPVSNRSIEPVLRSGGYLEPQHDLEAMGPETVLLVLGPADPPFAWTDAARDDARQRLKMVAARG